MPFKNTTPSGGSFADRIRKAGEHRHVSEVESRATRLQGKREPREPVFVNATLLIASGKLPAVVTNVNMLGARVEFSTNVTLKGDVVLVAPILNLNRRVRIAWQQSGSAGLIYAKQEPAGG